MNKSEFIAAMEAQLLRLPKADRDDILNDYESHFINGIAEGRTEEEVSAQLGDPVELAAVYLENLPEGAKGAPYIPAEEPAPAQSDYSEPQYSERSGEAAAAQAAPNAPAADEPNVNGIIIVVLLSVFVAVPALWSLIGIILGAFGCVFGGFAVAVALLAVGITALSVSVPAGIGLMLLSVALAAFAMLALFVGIIGIKGTIWLVKWYINWCKKLIGGNL